MLTRTTLHPQGPALHTPIRCEAAAHFTGRTIHLGSKFAPNPRLALRWLRCRTEDLADQLDHPAALPLRFWLHDQYEHERALHHLAHHQPYTLTTYEDSTRYTLIARTAP